MASLETLPRDVLALVLSRLVSERDASAVDCVCRTLLAANGDGAWKGFAVRGLLLREEHAVGHSSWRALIQTVVVPVVRLLRKVARPRTGRDGTQAAWSAEEAEAAHARNGLLPLEAAVGFGAMSHFGLTAMGQQGASTQSRVFFDRSRNTDDFVFMGSPDMRSGGEMVQYLQVRGSVACCPAPPDTGIEVEERVPQQHFAAGAVCMFFAQGEDGGNSQSVI